MNTSVQHAGIFSIFETLFFHVTCITTTCCKWTARLFVAGKELQWVVKFHIIHAGLYYRHSKMTPKKS